ncbi:MAG: phenylalanine--tRNA ligase subunit beta, partial [Armatimonadetes bacterium]|nr:phenylalanine--tRNA ligase subunit beta [Armatimonadota bacterium]
MKLPYSMILDLVQTKLTAQEVGDLLTMAGFELEGLDEVEGDSVLDIKVVANRGDGLSALGLAREILAKDPDSKGTELYQRAADHFPTADTATQAKAAVRIECDTCTRFACRIISGVKNGPSPDWLQKKLRQAGQRPISLLVDLTNFVMLELGQPLHAYDLEKLGGASIVVRNAREGEKLTTLNGEEHRLQTHHMVICNETEPVGVAGVMGGLDTEVSETTQDILLEAAHFTNSSVRKTRKDLGFNTEASYRFERSVDPCGVVGALNRFCELYVQCGGTGVENGVTDQFATRPSQTEVSLRLSRAVKLLGMPITHGEALQYLSRLGFEVKSDGENVKVKSPSWRPDILREEDLVEEIGRIHGYERIPETPIYGSNSKGGVFGIPRLADRAREALLRCGFHQAINHTLRDRHLLDFSKDWRMGPRNPHSPEMAYMRDSLLPGLAEVAQRNGGKNIQVFEIGKVFLQGEYQIDESPEIAILCTGERSQPSWAGNPPAQADFFS